MPKHVRTAQHPRRADRAARAAALREVSSKQSPHERLQVLDERLGEDVGAIKERLRLHHRIMAGERNIVEDIAETLFEGPAEPGEAPKKLKAKDRRAREKKLTVRQ